MLQQYRQNEKKKNQLPMKIKENIETEISLSTHDKQII